MTQGFETNDKTKSHVFFTDIHTLVLRWEETCVVSDWLDCFITCSNSKRSWHVLYNHFSRENATHKIVEKPKLIFGVGGEENVFQTSERPRVAVYRDGIR